MPRVPILEASATLALGAGCAAGLLALSHALRLRSPHPATSEALGWASVAAALLLVSLPSWATRRTPVVKRWHPAWICLLSLISLPAGYCVVHFGPSWSRSDSAGAVVTMALASVAHSAGLTGFLGARRSHAPNRRLSNVVCGGFAFIVVAFVAWAILFLE